MLFYKVVKNYFRYILGYKLFFLSFRTAGNQGARIFSLLGRFTLIFWPSILSSSDHVLPVFFFKLMIVGKLHAEWLFRIGTDFLWDLYY